MQALVRHLHAFLRDVRLTEEEWKQGIDFLTAAGHITDDRRQEFILLSDVLGASMQTIAINNEAYADATEATVFGPFFVDDAPHVELGGDIAGGATGQPCWVEGTVHDTDGQPVPGARIEVWEADEDGFYDVQYDDDRIAGRGAPVQRRRRPLPLLGDHPDAVPDPARRPGRARCSRPPVARRCAPRTCTSWSARPARAHWSRTSSCAATSCSSSDSVFGVKDSLVKDFVEQPPGTPTPDGRDLGDQSWSRVRFDIVLAPDGA